MNIQHSDAGTSSHNVAASVISKILTGTGATTISRMAAITAIIDAIKLTPENIDDPTIIQEVMGITAFVREPVIQTYIQSHIDSMDFPIHPVILALYLRNKNSGTSTVQGEKNTAVAEIISGEGE